MSDIDAKSGKVVAMYQMTAVECDHGIRLLDECRECSFWYEVGILAGLLGSKVRRVLPHTLAGLLFSLLVWLLLMLGGAGGGIASK